MGERWKEVEGSWKVYVGRRREKEGRSSGK
jgi:hypothetical protein